MERVHDEQDQPFSDYDRFAWFYNRYWGPDFCAAVFRIYDRILLPHLAPGARILDLCCGTGQIAARLLELGFRVTGLDGSAEMLGYAQVNAPAAILVHDDARRFDSAASGDDFEAVLSPFDSLNHILTPAELREVFIRVAAVLRPGGIFLFDLNLEDESDRRGASLEVVGEDHACIVRTSYRVLSKLKRYDLTLFRREGSHYERTDLTLYQQYHETETVLALLAAVGFDQIQIFDARTDFGPEASDSRVFFLARRP